MADDAPRDTITDPEDLPPPAIIPISGISKESRKYLEADEDEEGEGDDEGAAE